MSVVRDCPSDRPSTPPKEVLAVAIGFFLIGLLIQYWRLHSLSATYDQALFLQELWSTARGRFFESSLSSVLSAAVRFQGEPPRVDYLHLGQHANLLSLSGAPLVALLGAWALPLIQITLLTLAGLVLWRMASARLRPDLATQLTVAYYLSGLVIGPALENFHDLCWLPLLGFLVVEALLSQRWRQLLICAVLMLLVREDAGLTLFPLGLWALLRRPGSRLMGIVLMGLAFLYVAMMTGLIQPQVDSSLSDRFLQEKFGHLADDVSGGTFSVLWSILTHPIKLVQALVSPPGETLGFLLAVTLPLAFIPFLSVDVLLMVLIPLLIALLSQGRTALAVTLRYVLALVPGLFMGTMLWWQQHPGWWSLRWFRRFWTGCIGLGLVITLASNPHRSLSALVPDSFQPRVHVSPAAMLKRSQVARAARAMIPPDASLAADTPLLPLLADREVAIRFPRNVEYLDRDGELQSVDWVLAFPGYYEPFVPLFKRETAQRQSIIKRLRALTGDGRYRVVSCVDGLVVLRRVEQASTSSDQGSVSSPLDEHRQSCQPL
ncbi:MAG: DUF2079 domain-containing protein [Prochlorococcus sp.]